VKKIIIATCTFALIATFNGLMTVNTKDFTSYSDNWIITKDCPDCPDDGFVAKDCPDCPDDGFVAKDCPDCPDGITS